MKTTTYNCDFCGRELDIYTTDICTIIGDKNRDHYTHKFKLELCRWCYDKFFNDNIYKKLTEVKKKNVRRVN